MQQNSKKHNYRKIAFYTIIVISFVAIYVYNILTPYMSDDVLYMKNNIQNLGDILKHEYWSYFNHTGRIILEFLVNIFLLFPKSVFNVFNSFCFVGTMLLVYYNIREREKYDVFLYALINLSMWVFVVDFDQTVLWLTGACNYIWGIFIILIFISVYRFYLDKKDDIKNKVLAGVVLFITGLLGGGCNENTSGGAILIVLLLTLKHYLENKKIQKVMTCGIVGSIIGFAFMVMAPGNAARSVQMSAGDKTGMAEYISRGLKILKAIDKYLLLYMVVVCMLGAYFYYTKKYSLMEFYEVAIFVIAALATACVLILTSEPMPRAYFGANMFMMIAALQMVQKIREDDVLFMALKSGGIIAASIAMIFVYVEEGANLVRIRREYEVRKSYILEEKEKGNNQLILPMLRPVFESKYSMLHFVDISTDEEKWDNDVYEYYYDIELIEVLPWEEWEELTGIYVGD